jgi:hypothetical protein
MTTPDAKVWAAIRQAYETSPETVRQLAARFRVSGGQIAYRRQRDGWTPRPSGIDSLRIVQAKRLAGLSGSPTLPDANEPPINEPPLAEPEASDAAGRAARSTRIDGSITHQRAIIRRLYAVTDAKLAAIEDRIAAKDSLAGAAADREAREIAAILKTIEKLMELADALARPARAAADGDPKPGSAARLAAAGIADDAERLRDDLAQRLARLALGRGDPPSAA